MRSSKITDVKVGSSSLGVGKGLTIERIQVFVLEKSEVRCNREEDANRFAESSDKSTPYETHKVTKCEV